MEHDDEIEEITKELEDMLRMTSEKRNSIPKENGMGGIEELFEEASYEKEESGVEFFQMDDKEPDLENDTEDIDHVFESAESPFRNKKMQQKPHHKQTCLIKSSDGLIAAFFVPVIVMIIIFAQRGIFPFGEESFLRTDMYHQYAPFFSEFRNKLAHGGSLLYSWDIGMGVNFAALYSYYLASPLNWLLILCPSKYIIEFMTYMIVFKIGLSGLTFAWYLRRHFRTNDFGVAFFGIFYALSGYMAAYSWNIMWLDCIILFPLIMLGLERLVKKKKCFLYCMTLGLSILSNYYISIMICIFMVLYFMSLLVLEGKKPWKDTLQHIGNFTLYSLIAGGLSAIVLLPEIYALQMTASGDFNFPQTFNAYFSIFDMIARHFPAVETEIGLDHWPNIYCGIAVLMFFLLYLGCGRIRQKEKIVVCSLILFFFASFSINVLNFIWHGFHYPNSLPCRQSFIYIFLLLAACYHAYIHLDHIPWKHVVTAFFASVIFVLMAQKLITDDAYHFSVFYISIIFLSCYAGIILLYQKGSSRNMLVLLALLLVTLEAAVNTTVTSVTTTSRVNYVSDNQTTKDLASKLVPNDSFYRVKKKSYKTKNDGAWLNFPTVSLFSSTANANLSKFFKKIGCESSTNAYSITGSTPLVDALFAVKYFINSDKEDDGYLNLITKEDDMQLLENPYALSLGFMIPYDVLNNWQLDLTNPAEVQNDFSVVLGADPVLSNVTGVIKGTSYTFTPDQDGDYYVAVSNKKVEKVNAVLGEETKTFDNVNRGYLLELGFLKAGEAVTLTNNDNEQDLVAQSYRFSPKGLESVYQILNKNPLKLTRWSDTKIQGTVDADRAGLLFLSIPFDKGWSIKVDGKETEPYQLFDTFLSVHMTAGTHDITLEYMPQGLKTGGIITAVSILILLLLTGWTMKNKRRSKPMRSHSNK